MSVQKASCLKSRSPPRLRALLVLLLPDDEFCDRTTAPVPKWEVLAGNRVVWVQLCQQLWLGQGSLG
jgi:hypothetical protein